MRRPNRRERRVTALATRDRSLAALAIAVTLLSCATRPSDPAPKPDARARADWFWTSIGGENPDDADAIWSWTLHVALPDDDLEFELEINSDPKLAESGWIEERPSVQVTRSGGFEERLHSIHLFADSSAPRLVTPRPYYLIDNPGMRFRWIDPSSLPPTEPPLSSPPEPPNAGVPRVVVDRLVVLRDTLKGCEVRLGLDDVVMKWALPFLRSELAASEVH